MEEQSNIAYKRLAKEGAAKARSKSTNKRLTPLTTNTKGAETKDGGRRQEDYVKALEAKR
jgi:hypothetical protein